MCQTNHPHAAPLAQAAAAGTEHHCLCGDRQQGMQVTDSIRWVDAGHDMDLPPVPFPSRRIFEVAGEAAIRALVHDHHVLLKASDLGHLYPDDPARFAHAVGKAADFSVEACGGPAAFTSQHGGGCMRTRHFPFTIDEGARETWLQLLWQAFERSDFPVAVREEYWTWVEAMSIRMINRRTMKAQPRRFPFALAAEVMANGSPAVPA